ncbi:MAG TPA: PIG-L family deacetylase [Planctomycetaceae bacterium]|nr:PIG-L family deacetylase [Planctomycetaceae bacterium]HIQ20887.1 PIG-L family deacetylase [Planctomycetota bacterium]
MAHPDDAEFLCAGTLIRLAEAGWTIHIATAAPGDCGTATENRWDISSRRTREAAEAASRLGATYHCLDERDGFIVYDKPTLQKTYDLFRRIAPGLVFTHAPKDYMIDHEQASLLARAASFLYGAPNVSAFPVLEGSCVPYLYYCDPIEGVDPSGRPVKPTTVVDITAQLDKKTEMLACHASQREWLLKHHGVDEYLDSMKRHAAMRGCEAGVGAAEAFVQHLGHPYPRDDLLAALFPLHGATRV